MRCPRFVRATNGALDFRAALWHRRDAVKHRIASLPNAPSPNGAFAFQITGRPGSACMGRHSSLKADSCPHVGTASGIERGVGEGVGTCGVVIRMNVGLDV